MTTSTAPSTAPSTATSWQWGIHRDGYRRATDPAAGITLVATNRRTRGGWGPVVWWCYGRNGQLATGEVWQPGRYHALVRQAMYEAEQAAARIMAAPACDDCGGTNGAHDLRVEH